MQGIIRSAFERAKNSFRAHMKLSAKVSHDSMSSKYPSLIFNLAIQRFKGAVAKYE